MLGKMLRIDKSIRRIYHHIKVTISSNSPNVPKRTSCFWKSCMYKCTHSAWYSYVYYGQLRCTGRTTGNKRHIRHWNILQCKQHDGIWLRRCRWNHHNHENDNEYMKTKITEFVNKGSTFLYSLFFVCLNNQLTDILFLSTKHAVWFSRWVLSLQHLFISQYA